MCPDKFARVYWQSSLKNSLFIRISVSVCICSTCMCFCFCSFNLAIHLCCRIALTAKLFIYDCESFVFVSARTNRYLVFFCQIYYRLYLCSMYLCFDSIIKHAHSCFPRWRVHAWVLPRVLCCAGSGLGLAIWSCFGSLVPRPWR